MRFPKSTLVRVALVIVVGGAVYVAHREWSLRRVHGFIVALAAVDSWRAVMCVRANDDRYEDGARMGRPRRRTRRLGVVASVSIAAGGLLRWRERSAASSRASSAPRAPATDDRASATKRAFAPATRAATMPPCSTAGTFC